MRLPKRPLFFPDATRGMVRAVDNQDLKSTKTPGVLVNTYHLWRSITLQEMREMGGVRALMGWKGYMISDSGGFQAMSLIKRGAGKVTEEGLVFQPRGESKRLLTPEESIRYQLAMKMDLIVVLDDFTPLSSTKEEARETVERTIGWAKRSKEAYEAGLEELGSKEKPRLVAVVQGGRYADLRAECTQRLVEIGFDGYGYGGWSQTEEGLYDWQVAEMIAREAGEGKILFGLGVGKPEEVVKFNSLGWQVFDCVLPTRDARHGRMYVYKASTVAEIDVRRPGFYEYYQPDKVKNRKSEEPVSTACDCHTCRNYSRRYLYHLFLVKDASAWRLATIHNLRFYSLLMEKLRE